MDANWKHFSSHFDSNNQGKAESLRWLQELNDLRNRLSHPLRLREDPLNASEFATIERWKQFVGKLCQRISPPKLT
jgi:hypothetical protein